MLGPINPHVQALPSPGIITLDWHLHMGIEGILHTEPSGVGLPRSAFKLIKRSLFVARLVRTPLRHVIMTDRGSYVRFSLRPGLATRSSS